MAASVGAEDDEETLELLPRLVVVVAAHAETGADMRAVFILSYLSL
jgi:hypothetical protein